MAAPQSNVAAKQALSDQLWKDNPIFRQVLGICSALAVTNLLTNTFLMCLGLIWAVTMTNITVSALRNYTPARVRMMVTVLIIACYVIIVEVTMQAYFPDAHRIIGPYVGLIITNCIIMGRAEAFASQNRVWPAFCDGLGAGLGYSAVLLTIAVVREALGFGTFFGMALPLREHWWYSWTIMIMPPAGFFGLGLVVWACRGYALKKEDEEKGGAAA
jgi:Na+-transporting NADH:ubiquinone oxidoreductase subunit D